MSDRFVDAATAQERMRRLTHVVEHHALARHDARVGRIEEVLVEGPSKKDASRVSGRTRQNKLVHFAASGSAARPGSYVTVAITGAAPHWLRGELVDVVDAARAPRVRIPVASA
jgi:tRNA-2-methylthio-N6-dimethylallyladenosine synthase